MGVEGVRVRRRVTRAVRQTRFSKVSVRCARYGAEKDAPFVSGHARRIRTQHFGMRVVDYGNRTDGSELIYGFVMGRAEVCAPVGDRSEKKY